MLTNFVGTISLETNSISATSRNEHLTFSVAMYHLAYFVVVKPLGFTASKIFYSRLNVLLVMAKSAGELNINIH